MIVQRSVVNITVSLEATYSFQLIFNPVLINHIPILC